MFHKPTAMENHSRVNDTPHSTIIMSLPSICPTGPSGETPQRHSEFYFDDGSIIIHIGSSLFKVHRTILSAHSEIFADMFRMPQPAGEIYHDNCPMVTLTDPTSDFVNLLRAFYYPFYFDSLPSSASLSETIDFISGILSLSTKYFIPPFRAKCIALLKRIIPTNLSDYDAGHKGPLSDGLEPIARAITFARQHSVPEVLPYLYYHVACQISPASMLCKSSICLSWEDKAICLVGREMLRTMERLLSHRFLYEFKPLCGSSHCADSVGPLLQWRSVEQTSPSPLAPFKSWDNLKVCAKCILRAQKQHAEGRRDVWARLPLAFNLPYWDVLSEIQDL